MLVIFFTYQGKKSLLWRFILDKKCVLAITRHVWNSKGIRILFITSLKDDLLSDCIDSGRSKISVQPTDKKVPKMNMDIVVSSGGIKSGRLDWSTTIWQKSRPFFLYRTDLIRDLRMSAERGIAGLENLFCRVDNMKSYLVERSLDLCQMQSVEVENLSAPNVSR
jgi:hypothetical protein